jgi:hypothetical protein
VETVSPLGASAICWVSSSLLFTRAVVSTVFVVSTHLFCTRQNVDKRLQMLIVHCTPTVTNCSCANCQSSNRCVGWNQKAAGDNRTSLTGSDECAGVSASITCACDRSRTRIGPQPEAVTVALLRTVALPLVPLLPPHYPLDIIIV